MNQQQSTPAGALARREQGGEVVAQGMQVLATAGRKDLERIETAVKIPEDFQYEIKRSVRKNGQWVEEYKVGLTADAYDYINRAMGVSFFLPQWVHDEQGERQANPIHRKDYIYLRMAAVWYTPLGQLTMATEDVEVNYNLVWMDSRINARSATVQVGENGMPLFDDFGNPAVKLTPEDELKALKALSQLRSFGPRYAQTVARVRLLKMATGVRSLPIERPAEFLLKVVGFRDRLTPQERVNRVEQDSTQLYGARPADQQPLRAAEIAEVQDIDRDDEAIDRDRLQASEPTAAPAAATAAATPEGPADDEKGLPEIAGTQQKAPWTPTEG